MNDTNKTDRFVSKPTDFVGIAGPTLVYIGVASRERFDQLAAPCIDHGEKSDGHVLTKQVGDFTSGEVVVIFQHWLKQLTTDAMIADRRAASAEAKADDAPDCPEPCCTIDKPLPVRPSTHGKQS